MGKILIVDDQEDNLYVATQILENDHHEVLTASNGQATLEIASTEQPDVILLDIQMPGLSGFEVCQKLKTKEETRQIPIIFITAKYKDGESVSKGLLIGADDYIVKPFSTLELRARVNVMVRLRCHTRDLATQNAELARLNEMLEEKNNELELARKYQEELATTDSLTQLHNRRYFTERLKEEFLLIRRTPHPISLLIFDIDFFKKINDTYGHLAGDAVLIQFSKILQQSIRKHDTLARFGGEEFIIAMYGADCQAAALVGERIRQEVEQFDFTDEGHILHLTISVGIASFPEVCHEHPELTHLLQKADAALYYAKEHGRNQIVSALPSSAFSTHSKGHFS